MNDRIPEYLILFVLTGTVAIFIAVLTGLHRALKLAGWQDRDRRRAGWSAAALIIAWYVAGLVLSWSGFYLGAPSRIPTMQYGILIPIAAGIALFWLSPLLRRIIDSVPQRWIVSVQLYRAMGVIFLLLYAGGHLPGRFAWPAGVGDITVGLFRPCGRSGLRARIEQRSGACTRLESAWDHRFDRGDYDRLPQLAVTAPDVRIRVAKRAYHHFPTRDDSGLCGAALDIAAPGVLTQIAAGGREREDDTTDPPWRPEYYGSLAAAAINNSVLNSTGVSPSPAIFSAARGLTWLTMAGVAKPIGPARKRKLSAVITLRAFDNGYWYAAELRSFAVKMRIPSASKLRKDQLEAAIKDLLFDEGAKFAAISVTPKQGPRDVDRGLRLDLPVVHYTSNKETKLFIDWEVSKIQPGVKRVPGTRYLLNRWREEQIAAGRSITYRDLVIQAIALNDSKRGPLRLEHGRYMNFISDYMADNQSASHDDAVRAWHQVKAMDAPKTYSVWARLSRR